MTTDTLTRLPSHGLASWKSRRCTRTLQATAPITPARTPAGDVAWLVTGYAEVKTLLADPWLGRSHPEPERAAQISASAILGVVV